MILRDAIPPQISLTMVPKLDGKASTLQRFLDHARWTTDDELPVRYYLLSHFLRILVIQLTENELILQLQELTTRIGVPIQMITLIEHDSPQIYISLPLLYLFLHWTSQDMDDYPIQKTPPPSLALPHLHLNRTERQSPSDDLSHENIKFPQKKRPEHLLSRVEEKAIFFVLTALRHTQVLQKMESISEETFFLRQLYIKLMLEQLYIQPQLSSEPIKQEVIDALLSQDIEYIIELIVKFNIGLIRKFARKYSEQGLDFDDLEQLGQIGLNRAIELFDYTKGHAFSTYASWWINKVISRETDYKGHSIRKPARMSEKIRIMKAFIRDFYAYNQRLPAKQEVADHMKVSQKTISYWSHISRKWQSLDEPLSDDPDSDTTGDLIPSPEADVVAAVLHNSQQGELAKALSMLCDSKGGIRLCYIVMETWGIPPELCPQVYQQYTLSVNTDPKRKKGRNRKDGLTPARPNRDIANDLGLHTERIRQLQAQAYERLQKIFIEIRDLEQDNPPQSS